MIFTDLFRERERDFDYFFGTASDALLNAIKIQTFFLKQMNCIKDTIRIKLHSHFLLTLIDK